jgi:hypothetical protein
MFEFVQISKGLMLINGKQFYTQPWTGGVGIREELERDLQDYKRLGLRQIDLGKRRGVCHETIRRIMIAMGCKRRRGGIQPGGYVRGKARNVARKANISQCVNSVK